MTIPVTRCSITHLITRPTQSALHANWTSTLGRINDETHRVDTVKKLRSIPLLLVIPAYHSLPFMSCLLIPQYYHHHHHQPSLPTTEHSLFHPVLLSRASFNIYGAVSLSIPRGLSLSPSLRSFFNICESHI